MMILVAPGMVEMIKRARRDVLKEDAPALWQLYDAAWRAGLKIKGWA